MEEFNKGREESGFEEEHSPPKEHTSVQSHHSGSGAEHHHIHHVQHQGQKTQIKYNLWKILAVLLAIVLVVTLYFGFFNEGNISKDKAAEQTLDFVNNQLLQGQTTATLVGIEDAGDLYNIKLSVSGQLVDGYMTKDGSLFFPTAIEVGEVTAGSEEAPVQAAPELPKTAKPKVELFVMSHCPYGTQAEKALIPVVEELGEKIDFSIKFVNYAMHGEKEVLEEMNQVCIENEQNAKYLDYLSCFLKEGDGETCLTEAEIDKTKLSTCVQKLDTEFNIKKNLADETTWSGGRYPPFLVHDAENKEYSVQGSPTLIINGEQASATRSPSAYLAAICGAFSEVPEECAAELSTAPASAGFGFETTGAATTASCG